MISTHVHQFYRINKICSIVTKKTLCLTLCSTSIIRNSKLLSRYLVTLSCKLQGINAIATTFMFLKTGLKQHMLSKLLVQPSFIYVLVHIPKKSEQFHSNSVYGQTLLHPSYLGLGLTSICRPAHDQT